MTTVPISELKQRTGQVLQKAVIDKQDVIIERYGQEYAVILSRTRYQQLLDATRNVVMERFREVRCEIHAANADIPEEEIAESVATAMETSRKIRADRF